jgi:hypothetical protein
MLTLQLMLLLLLLLMFVNTSCAMESGALPLRRWLLIGVKIWQENRVTPKLLPKFKIACMLVVTVGFAL